MRLRLFVVMQGLLLVLPLLTGCTIPQVIDFFHPKGSPIESGISKEQRCARIEQENIRQATGQPFTSDRE